MLDLPRWIEDASDARQRRFREATQLVLRAIARSSDLAPVMIMKGGVLLAIRLGYASRTNRPAMERLAAGLASDVVRVDYSFNEWASDAEVEPLDGGALRVYPFADLVAEKLRSLLQQPIRRRARYQDLYDLTVLLASGPVTTEEERASILMKLRAACANRVALDHQALSRPEVRYWTALEYDTALPALLRTNPPPFDAGFALVLDFYESLPW